MNTAFEKTRARVQAKARRQDYLNSGEGSAAAISLLSHFPILRFRRAVIGGFWPLIGEIDLCPLLFALWEQGHILSLPCTPRKGRPLTFREWTPKDQLKAGPYGTREPTSSAPEISPAFVLVPLLAFSPSGERLGYGGGFYDRTLSELRAQGDVFACGAAFAAQETAHIPTDVHDQPLDGILTDQFFRTF